VLDKTGSLALSFPVQIIYRIVSYRTPFPSQEDKTAGVLTD